MQHYTRCYPFEVDGETAMLATESWPIYKKIG